MENFQVNPNVSYPMTISLCDHTITFTATNIHIENSYEVKSSVEMVNILSRARLYTYHVDSLIPWLEEWKAHNILYKFHIFRSHTKDVDLNAHESKLKRRLYKLVSKLYNIFN